MITSDTHRPYLVRIPSPIGRIEIIGDDTAVTQVTIARNDVLPHDDEPERGNEIIATAAAQLTEYFDGSRRDFTVPVRLAGTQFQQSVWSELRVIDFGSVTSYGALGHATGRGTAGRAVGGAVGANPVPIIVPCHRVLAAGGRITGYSGGNGIPTKEWLLAHEGIAHS